MTRRAVRVALVLAFVVAAPSFAHAADALRRSVDAAIEPLMAKNDVAGMAVAVVDGDTVREFDYGVASRATKRPVTSRTLFELGSISKTLTVTLAAHAQARGLLSFEDPVEKFLPAYAGTPFGRVSLVGLATHTGGGFPLQVPDQVRNDDDLVAWLRAWRPMFPEGTQRTYANPGIGMLGRVVATALGKDFTAAMEGDLLPALGMRDTFVNVPPDRMDDYAQGYARDGRPIRVAPGVLAAEAYGMKSAAGDVLRFVRANMDAIPLDDALRRAIASTHTGWFRAGPMTQDAIWEQYPYPVRLAALLEGNGPDMIFEPHAVVANVPPQAPRADVWINKTGSTNGFGGYVAFIPSKRLGLVMLANRSVPIDQRVRAAYAILSALAAHRPG